MAVVVFVLVASGVALQTTRSVARARSFQLFGRLVDRVETREPIVALTFDDGPTPAVIDRILQHLQGPDVRATFFVNGHHLAENPGLARRTSLDAVPLIIEGLQARGLRLVTVRELLAAAP